MQPFWTLLNSAIKELFFDDCKICDFFNNIFVENALKKLNKGGMLIIECSPKETLEGFDKIAKFGDKNLLYWKV